MHEGVGTGSDTPLIHYGCLVFSEYTQQSRDYNERVSAVWRLSKSAVMYKGALQVLVKRDGGDDDGITSDCLCRARACLQ